MLTLIWLVLAQSDRMRLPYWVYWRARLRHLRSVGLRGVHVRWTFDQFVVPITLPLICLLLIPYIAICIVLPSSGVSDDMVASMFQYVYLFGASCFVGMRIGKQFYGVVISLHNSIRDDQYLVGQDLVNWETSQVQ
uniref:RING-type E3 ubiquitin transferase n=1 Tax=Polyblepharides amylifera TaxID=1486889 RepID=A0A7R9SV90_9CHLO